MLNDFLEQFAAQNGLELNRTDNSDNDTHQPGPQKVRRQHLKYHLDKRRGKVATIITGFVGSDDELAAFAGELKRHLAIGGSVRDGEILLQGDVADKVRAYMSAKQGV